MKKTINSWMFPRTIFYIFGLIYICFACRIRWKSYIISSIMISKTTCPRTFSIFIFSISKSLFIISIKHIINIIYDFPINKIIRFHNWNSWIHVHCSTCHIIGISYPNNIIIRYICPYKWILGPITCFCC